MAATLEQAKELGIVPWDTIESEQETVVVFRDNFPVTRGHLLFVPRENTAEGIMDCFMLAYKYGQREVIVGNADGFNVGMNNLAAAGQTVMYPHVHMIPRRNGDCADPVGGVRAVIPGQSNYRKSGYRVPA